MSKNCKTYMLKPISSQSVKSFYGKARYEVDEDTNSMVLYSYCTPVLGFCNSKFYRLSDEWSQTTQRHIKAFAALNGKNMNKQSFFDLPFMWHADFIDLANKMQDTA